MLQKLESLPPAIHVDLVSEWTSHAMMMIATVMFQTLSEEKFPPTKRKMSK